MAKDIGAIRKNQKEEQIETTKSSIYLYSDWRPDSEDYTKLEKIYLVGL